MAYQVVNPATGKVESEQEVTTRLPGRVTAADGLPGAGA